MKIGKAYNVHPTKEKARCISSEHIVREGSGSSKRSRDVRIERVSIPFSSQVYIGHNVDSTRDTEDHLSDVSSSLLGCDFQKKAIDRSLNLEGDVAENGGQQTAHEKRKLKAAKAWELSRASIFRCAVECSTLPKVLCQHCNKATSSVYCKQSSS